MFDCSTPMTDASEADPCLGLGTPAHNASSSDSNTSELDFYGQDLMAVDGDIDALDLFQTDLSYDLSTYDENFALDALDEQLLSEACLNRDRIAIPSSNHGCYGPL
jgi:hypothetical protein